MVLLIDELLRFKSQTQKFVNRIALRIPSRKFSRQSQPKPRPRRNPVVKPILLFGPPWGGKGTLGRRLAIAIRDSIHFDNGAALRERAARDPEFAEIYARYERSLVPDQYVFETLELAVQQVEQGTFDGPIHLFLDGVPRNPEQLKKLLRLCKEKGWRTPIALHVNAKREITFERLQKYPREDRGEHLMNAAELKSYFDERMATFDGPTATMIRECKSHWLVGRVHPLPVRKVDCIAELEAEALKVLKQN